MNSAPKSTPVPTVTWGRPWYPFVFAVYPLWYVYLTNYGQVTATAALTASMVAGAVVASMLWVAARLINSRAVAAVAVTVVIAAFYAYGPLHDLYLRMSALPKLSPFTRWIVDSLVNHI